MNRSTVPILAGIVLLVAVEGAAAQQCQPFNLQTNNQRYFPFNYYCNDADFTANPRAAEDGDGDTQMDDKLCTIYPNAARRRKLEMERVPKINWELPDGKNAGDKIVIKDKAGNEFELWCLDRSDNKTANDPNAGDNRGGHQYGLKFIPAGGGPAVWVGRCKFEAGYNTVFWGKKANGNFAYSVFSNLNSAPQSENANLQKRDVYLFDVTTGCLEVRGEKRPFPTPPNNGATDPLGVQLQWLVDRNVIRGPAPQSFSDLIKDFSSGTTDGPGFASRASRDRDTDSDDCPTCQCTTDSVSVFVYGVARGGTIEIRLFGDTVSVATIAGQPADSAIVHLIEALYAHPDLDSMLVRPIGLPGEIRFRNIAGGALSVAWNDGGLLVQTNELPAAPTSAPIAPWAMVTIAAMLVGSGLVWLGPWRRACGGPGVR